jgi:genome maintenance exonuclease 1
MFTHVELKLPNLERENIENIRYYKIPTDTGIKKLISITSIISHYKKDFFDNWRKRVGVEKANEITKRATSRGTDMHSLIENYLYNIPELPEVQELSKTLFENAIPTLRRINNIHALEGSLYSSYFGIAGTVDCVAEFDGELAIIDFKSSAKPKPREWIDGYFVQCAAYACMLHELTGLSVKKFVIIMSCEDGQCVVYQEYDIKKYIKLLMEYIRKFVSDKLD